MLYYVSIYVKKNKSMRKSQKELIFVTGNKYKFQVAKKSLEGSGFRLVQKKLDIPEIQSELVEEVAAFSGRWAADTLKKPVAVSDGGCYIESLNGFPGPFIKYINKWLSANDMLNLMKGKKNRRVFWRDCLAYCESGKKPVTFVCDFESGTLAKKSGARKYRKDYGWIDTLFIPKGYIKPLSEWPDEEYINFWSSPHNYDSWLKLAEYLKKKK